MVTTIYMKQKCAQSSCQLLATALPSRWRYSAPPKRKRQTESVLAPEEVQESSEKKLVREILYCVFFSVIYLPGDLGTITMSLVLISTVTGIVL